MINVYFAKRVFAKNIFLIIDSIYVLRTFSSTRGIEDQQRRVIALIFVPIIIYMGLIVLNLFPTLKISKRGINVGYLPFITLRLTWSRIEKIEQINNPIFLGTYVIVIKNSKGNRSLIGPFHFSIFHGRWAGARSPGIIISDATRKKIQKLIPLSE